jgi:hypothetical protein
MKRAGIRSIGTPLRCVTILIDESAVTEARGENPMRPNEHEQSGRADVDPEAETIEHREQSLDDALKGTFPASDPPAALAPHSSKE